MSADAVLILAVGVLFATGVYLLMERSLTRILLGFLLVGNGANLLILHMGGPAGEAPIITEGVGSEEMSDPLPQALILTAIVITFGVTAFVVNQRRREISIRMAIGADRGHVVRSVFTQGMRPVLIGLGVGLGLAFFGTHDPRSERVTHVGMMLDEQRFIHARGGQCVRINSLAEEDWQRRLTAARRFL